MITYTAKTTTIKKQFPRGWDPSTLTGVTLQIKDVDGVELQVAAAAALYTATSIDGDASRFAYSFTLDAGAGALVPGDIIRIVGVNGQEDHIVKGWDDTNKVVDLETYINRDFEDGAAVYRLSAVATVDFSNATTYPAGTQLVLVWTPTGSGSSFTERAEIETRLQVDVAAFTADFRALYPRAYDALSVPADRLDTIIRLALDELRLILLSRGLDMARVVDQRLISPPLMALVARYWTINGDENLEDERKVIDAAYSAAVEQLCTLPIWEDSDGDEILDEGEIQDHPVYFERVW